MSFFPAHIHHVIEKLEANNEEPRDVWLTARE